MSSLPCKDCASGVLHQGTPKGTVTTVHGLPTYVAEPPEGERARGVVVIIPDAFGWELVNNRIIADNYASKGKFKVYLPDFMNGHWLSHDLLHALDNATDEKAGIMTRLPSGLRAITGFLPFMFFNRLAVTSPRVHGFLRGLRDETNLPVGAAGFCWGGKFVTLLSSSEPKTADGTKPLIDCGYTAHPSMLELPKDAEAIRLPYSVAYPTKDFGLPADKWKLMKMELDKKETSEYVEYENAKHGFAIRGNPNDPVEGRQADEAEVQAIKFFTKNFEARSKL